MKFSARQLADAVGGDLEGNPDEEVWKLSGIEDAKSGCVSFLSNDKYKDYVYSTKASIVIVDKEFVPVKPCPTLIRVDKPYETIVGLLVEYRKTKTKDKVGIEKPSYISEDVSYGDGFYLGMFAYIGSGVRMGKNVKIYPHSYVGDNVKIGDDVTVYSGVNIYSDTQIGDRCVINSGCVLGSDGFGFIPDNNMVYNKVPQVGDVILEDDVDLGACVTIDKATLGSTIVKKGVKLDNQVHIAHNVTVGENTVIAAQAGIAGSTKIGRSCMIGGQTGIVGHLKIADKTRIQAQSGVTKSTKSGDAVQGTPAFDYGSYNKSYVYFKKLPGILKTIEDSIENKK